MLEPAREFAAASRFGQEYVVWRRGDEENDFDPRLGHHWQRRSEDGDLFMLWYAHLKRIGHVGFIVAEDEKWYTTIEGNTSEAGSREGTTVRKRKRLKDSVHLVSRVQ